MLDGNQKIDRKSSNERNFLPESRDRDGVLLVELRIVQTAILLDRVYTALRERYRIELPLFELHDAAESQATVYHLELRHERI